MRECVHTVLRCAVCIECVCVCALCYVMLCVCALCCHAVCVCVCTVLSCCMCVCCIMVMFEPVLMCTLSVGCKIGNSLYVSVHCMYSVMFVLFSTLSRRVGS